MQLWLKSMLLQHAVLLLLHRGFSPDCARLTLVILWLDTDEINPVIHTTL